jgi:hypothetical protein
MYEEIREIIPVFEKDTALYPFVQKVKDHIMKD